MILIDCTLGIVVCIFELNRLVKTKESKKYNFKKNFLTQKISRRHENFSWKICTPKFAFQIFKMSNNFFLPRII